MSCRVKVAQGILEGKKCVSFLGQNYISFEGVPYAKPPVGKLRFRDPQEPEPWAGVRKAINPGNKCPQINPYGAMTFGGSEDCLYLNVYTPCLPAEKIEKLPVLFFVHGGRLVIGYSDYYRPDYLIRHGVILVTINYRINILGFLCLHTPEVPGNAGAKDTIMALKWVKSNIEHFNGDKNNIIAYGESAGAGLISSYLTSKMADGLVDKMICQSGSVLSDLFIVDTDEVEKARFIAKTMGADLPDEKLCDYLTEAPIEDLINAFVVAETSRGISTLNAYFLPVVEKEFQGVVRFFEEHPRQSIREGRFKKLPILNTICSHEGALFMQTDGNGNVFYEDNLQHLIPKFLSIKHNTPEALKIADGLRSYYLRGKECGPDVKIEYLDLLSDAYFGRDTLMFLDSVSAGNHVYSCYFSFFGSLNTGTMKRLRVKGASHGDLIQYLFYRKNKDGKYKGAEKIMVDTLTEAWCNFAKTGKPSWTNQKFEWLPYTRDKRHCLSVDDELNLVPQPNYERYKVWLQLLFGKSKM